MRRVFLSTKTAILLASFSGYDDLLCRFLHGCAYLEIQARFREDFATFLDICAFETQDDGHPHIQIFGSLDDALCEGIDAEDSAEDVDEDGLDVLVGEKNLEGMLNLLLVGSAAY